MWQVRSDSAIQTVCSKEAYTENFRKISRKTKKMCANIPTGFFYIASFKGTKMSKND